MVLLSGDVPLLTPATLEQSGRDVHRGAQAAATVVTATVERPLRLRPDRPGRTAEIARIVEERDASPAERQIHEINSGIYAFDLAPLFDALRSIASQNAQGEYLPDRSRRDLPAAQAAGGDASRGRPTGNPRH